MGEDFIHNPVLLFVLVLLYCLPCVVRLLAYLKPEN